MVKFFHRDDLDADTVVPQVTDNQLLLEDHFQELVEKGLGYEDQSVREMRSKAARNELMRALLYSSQVVVNRIGYRNNPFLIDLFREGATDSKAFQDLMRSNAIVPFFYRESSLVDDLDFSTFEDGDRACKYLADSLQGDYGYCRLAKDDATNRSQTAEMGRIFSNYFLGLRTLEVGQCNEMYADLSGSQEKTPEGFEEFIAQLDRLHDFAYSNTGRGQSLRRESIYEKFFISPVHLCSERSLGRVSESFHFWPCFAPLNRRLLVRRIISKTARKYRKKLSLKKLELGWSFWPTLGVPK